MYIEKTSELKSNTDHNVLIPSPIFKDIWTEKARDMFFTVNGHSYKHSYYLCDEIYHDHSKFMKTYMAPRTEKTKLFTKRHESARNDIERGFRIFKQTWHLVKYVGRIWDIEKLKRIMCAYIITHNMIIKHEGEAILHVQWEWHR